MLANKDPSAIVAPLADQLLSLSVVPAPGHDAHAPEDFAPFTALPVRNFTDVPAALARVIGRCLEIDASRRFQSADELSAALEPFSSRHLPHDGGGGASGGGQSGRHSRGGPADAAPGGKRSRAQWRELVPGWFSGSLGAS